LPITAVAVKSGACLPTRTAMVFLLEQFLIGSGLMKIRGVALGNN
jgi:hypothetical protein